MGMHVDKARHDQMAGSVNDFKALFRQAGRSEADPAIQNIEIPLRCFQTVRAGQQNLSVADFIIHLFPRFAVSQYRRRAAVLKNL